MESVTVTFLRDFDYHLGLATISYRGGATYEVDLTLAAFAMDSGAAIQDDSDPAFDPEEVEEEKPAKPSRSKAKPVVSDEEDAD